MKAQLKRLKKSQHGKSKQNQGVSYSNPQWQAPPYPPIPWNQPPYPFQTNSPGTTQPYLPQNPSSNMCKACGAMDHRNPANPKCPHHNPRHVKGGRGRGRNIGGKGNYQGLDKEKEKKNPDNTEPFVCWNCNGVGHRADVCPSPPSEKGLKQNQNLY